MSAKDATTSQPINLFYSRSGTKPSTQSIGIWPSFASSFSLTNEINLQQQLGEKGRERQTQIERKPNQTISKIPFSCIEIIINMKVFSYYRTEQLFQPSTTMMLFSSNYN